jgi:ribosome assembly protein YihI (activator of Der GTPase)
VNKRNYHQARRQKEESRKARQEKKLQRRLGRAPAAADSGETETSPAELVQPIDPATTSSS